MKVSIIRLSALVLTLSILPEAFATDYKCTVNIYEKLPIVAIPAADFGKPVAQLAQHGFDGLAETGKVNPQGVILTIEDFYAGSAHSKVYILQSKTTSYDFVISNDKVTAIQCPECLKFKGLPAQSIDGGDYSLHLRVPSIQDSLREIELLITGSLEEGADKNYSLRLFVQKDFVQGSETTASESNGATAASILNFSASAFSLKSVHSIDAGIMNSNFSNHAIANLFCEP